LLVVLTSCSPTGGPDSRRLPRRTALLLTLGTLSASNVATNRVLPPAAYVPWNLAVTAALLQLAHRSGCDAVALGLERRQLARGLRVGALGAAAVAVVYTAMLNTAATRTAFDDERAAAANRGLLVWMVLVRIPLGTVVLEEIAFRSLLPALIPAGTGGTWLGPGVSSLLFGLWHILPAAGLPQANAAMRRAVGNASPLAQGALAIASTALGGMVLQVIRRVGNHVVAAAIVHTATNSLGYMIAHAIRVRTAIQVSRH
jgi:membrane protease YdiL (CAAX protease family)